MLCTPMPCTPLACEADDDATSCGAMLREGVAMPCPCDDDPTACGATAWEPWGAMLGGRIERGECGGMSACGATTVCGGVMTSGALKALLEGMGGGGCRGTRDGDRWAD